ncbi:MAG: ABC transporter permease [Acidobacteria bacterium]|nr:ABC transporter permease [Acidobacteriota bacterium]
MKNIWMLTLVRMKLATRNRAFLFFSVIMPLAYLFLYIGVFGRGQAQATPYLFAPVLSLTVMGSLWGLSMQLVMFREQGILRRFHLAPVGPAAMLSSSILSNLVLIFPTVLIEIILAETIFHLKTLGNLWAFWILVALGTMAFASLGLIVASVANTMQETQVINNAIWFLCLFFSGATLPFAILPSYVQQLALFLPATYLVTGLQQVLMRGIGVTGIFPEIIALVGGLGWAFYLSVQLFRWEPEAKVTRRAKFMALATIIPFLLLGLWETKYGGLRNEAKSNFDMISRPSPQTAPEQPK